MGGRSAVCKDMLLKVVEEEGKENFYMNWQTRDSVSTGLVIGKQLLQHSVKPVDEGQGGPVKFPVYSLKKGLACFFDTQCRD